MQKMNIRGEEKPKREKYLRTLAKSGEFGENRIESAEEFVSLFEN